MIEYLSGLDTQAFTAINAWHVGYVDNFMWIASSRLAWLLCIVAVAVMMLRKGWRHGLLALVAIALVVLVADQVSSGLIKQMVERLRPSHNPNLAATIHLVRGYQGGLYGFVSSHAANSVASCLLLSLMMRRRGVMLSLLLWTVLQCYSRVYLGVHYPGDIAGGLLVGSAVAMAVYPLWRWCSVKLCGEVTAFGSRDACLVVSAVLLSLLVIAVMAIFM